MSVAGERRAGSTWRVETLAYLLRIRQNMQRRRLLMYIGEKRVERLACFVDGYRACLHANGSGDQDYERFVAWLQDVKGQAAGGGWQARFLRDCHGEHEQAIRKYLDLVAEFATREGLLAKAGEGEAIGGDEVSCIGTIEVLLQVREDMAQGQLLPSMSEMSPDCLETFVEGCHACVLANGFSDERYGRFFEWLREVKRELPGEGWPAKYLRDCRGDHAQAIRKYLGFVAEFAALEDGQESGPV